MANDDKYDYLEVLQRSGLSAYKPPPKSVFEGREESEKTVAPPKSAGITDVGPFEIHTTMRAKTCGIKLYENLENGKVRLRGTWSGTPGECNSKKDKIVRVVREIGARRRGEIEGIPIPKYEEKKAQNARIEVQVEGNPSMPSFSMNKAKETAKALSSVQSAVVTIEENGKVIETWQYGRRQ